MFLYKGRYIRSIARGQHVASSYADYRQPRIPMRYIEVGRCRVAMQIRDDIIIIVIYIIRPFRNARTSPFRCYLRSTESVCVVRSTALKCESHVCIYIERSPIKTVVGGGRLVVVTIIVSKSRSRF